MQTFQRKFNIDLTILSALKGKLYEVIERRNKSIINKASEKMIDDILAYQYCGSRYRRQYIFIRNAFFENIMTTQYSI